MPHPAGYHVAQLNIGQLWFPTDDLRTAEFTDNSDRVNAVAERSSGFVWRCIEDVPASMADGLTLYPNDPCALRTLSVWETPDALAHFVMRTVHGAFLKRRDVWFRPQTERTYVIWPIAVGHRPDVKEVLEDHGPTERAYDFAYLRDRAGS